MRYPRIPVGAAWAAPVLLALAGCTAGAASPDPPSPVPSDHALLALGEEGQPELQVVHSSDAEEVVLLAGPFEVPAHGAHDATAEHGEDHDHRHGHGSAHDGPTPSGHGAHGGHGGSDDVEHRSPLLPVEWPARGWLAGFQVALYDGEGTPISRDVLHHLIAVNFERRQVVYPVPERIFGVGQETSDVVLPRQIGVPLEAGDRIGIYASWHNATDQDLDEVYIRLTMPFRSAEDHRRPREVLPIYMDVNYGVGESNAYDLPPGRSVRSDEFEVPVSGNLLGVSGHLHDYGLVVRLEDAETDEVLVEVEGVRDEAGRVLAMEQKVLRRFFGLRDASVRLEAGRRYRITGIYDSPLAEPVPAGAMAHMVGIFEPDEWSEWTEIDLASPLAIRDMERLPVPLEPVVELGER